MDKVYKGKEDCCGCSACLAACPVQAIKMVPDDEGFLYPLIDQERCINCKKCIKVCPVRKRKEIEFSPSLKAAFAVRTLDEAVLQHSSSGGAAYEFAKAVIAEGGSVAGAAFGEHSKIKHILIDKPEEISALQGSKYVQSELGSLYQKVAEQLNLGKSVLFTGTPCQVEGLLSFLPKEYPNLITQDLICHGVPSPLIWKQYLKENNFYDKDVSFCFRDKDSGWESSSFSIERKGHKKLYSLFDNPYMYFFLNNYSLRPICFCCPFKTERKLADLTCADLWGAERVLENGLRDDLGMSLVLVNTPKGKDFFKKVTPNLFSEACSYEKAKQENLMLVKSVEKLPQREAFFSDLRHTTLKQCLKKYKPKDPFVLSVKKKLYWLLKSNS